MFREKIKYHNIFVEAKGLASTYFLEQIPLPQSVQAIGQTSHCLHLNSLNDLKVLSAMTI